MEDKTLTFKALDEKELTQKEILTIVTTALRERGFNPERQLIGYFISGDPTYITSHMNARNLIKRVDKYEFLEGLIRDYLK